MESHPGVKIEPARTEKKVGSARRDYSGENYVTRRSKGGMGQRPRNQLRGASSQRGGKKDGRPVFGKDPDQRGEKACLIWERGGGQSSRGSEAFWREEGGGGGGGKAHLGRSLRLGGTKFLRRGGGPFSRGNEEESSCRGALVEKRGEGSSFIKGRKEGGEESLRPKGTTFLARKRLTSGKKGGALQEWSTSNMAEVGILMEGGIPLGKKKSTLLF